jgi:hypothetical protein
MRRALRCAHRHWLRLSITVLLTGLTVNAWAQVGTAAFLVLAFASIGCALVITLTGLAAGTSVARQQGEPRSVAAKRAVKELTR